jgi:hypothetical protein
MSSNKITTTSPIKSLELKTKEENTKLFKDDVLDKFNFWIYVGFILLGLLLLFSLILLIYSLFSSPKAVIEALPPINIENKKIELPEIKPVVIKTPIPVPVPVQVPEINLKKPEVVINNNNSNVETKPSFFSSFFGKKKEITNPNPPKITINSNPTIIPTPTYNSTPANSSFLSNFFSSLTKRTNIPKPLNNDNKMKGGKRLNRYKY